jgi:hypothetical protein
MEDSMIQLASQVQAEYKDGLSYKKQQGYLDHWSTYERFRAGDQWPKATDRTKDLPRPVFNVIDQIQAHKVSSVMNENIKMVFSAMETAPQTDPTTGQPTEDPEIQAADLFTRYADASWERIKQDDLNEEALDSASNTGTCIWHYYWDASKFGGNKLKWVGEMEGEIIDPVNFFPSNPQQRDVQKQQYIIITHRDDVKHIQEEAKNNGVSQELVALITPDKDTQDQAYDMAKDEITSSKKATIITKYWRENGYIYFLKVCGNVVVKSKTNTNRKLYPLEVMQWKRRKKSIFGVGDTEGLIPNQKSINFLIAMQILSVQNTGWPKMLIKREFIRQNPTNVPGEILVDSGPPGSWNAQYMVPGMISQAASGLVESILQYTKEVSGANESAMGEQVSAQLNAAAISLLQKQSGIPIESIRRRFYQSMENIARIWEEFFKVNYNTTRMVTVKDENQDPYTTQFNGSQFQDTQMELKIDIGPATGYSETMVMNTLDKFYDKGDIDISMYLKYVPANVAPFKERMLKDIQENQANAPQQPQDIPSLSISYKDLPLTGQMQVAQKAGIELQPEDFTQQIQAQQQPQVSQQHPFDQLLAQLPANEQANFKKMAPEQQKALVDQMMAHMQRQQGQQMMSQGNMPPMQQNMMQQG